MLVVAGNAAWATGETFTLSLNSSATQTRSDGGLGDFFTVTGTSYNKKYTGTYNGTSYTAGWKVEDSSSITFTTSAAATVTIVQSRVSDSKTNYYEGRYIKLDDTEYTDRTEDETNSVCVYTITGVETGSHTIIRSGKEIGLLYVEVVYTGTVKTQLGTPTINYDASTGVVTITPAVEGQTVKYTTDGTTPTADNGETYIKAFTVADGTTVTAVAIASSDTEMNSEAATTQVLLSGVTLEAAVVKCYNNTVAITSANEGTKIEYSLDGSTYTEYTRTFNITENCTIYTKVSRDNCTTVEGQTAVTALAANTKSKTIYMGYGSFTLHEAGSDGYTYSTLTGNSGDDAEGYSLILSGNSGRDWSSGTKGLTCGSETRTAIKGSNGAQNTLILPDGVKATRITFYSYVNASESAASVSGWKEVNGTSYQGSADGAYTDYPMGNFSSNSDYLTNPDIRVYPLDNVTGSITFNNGGSQLCFAIALDVIESETVNVGSTGYATFSSDKNLDFSSVDGIKAYVASSASEGTVQMTEIEQVPAETGVILKAEGEATATVTAIESASYEGTNLLVATVEATTVSASADGTYNYFLANGTSGVGFYKLTADTESAAGKAYLQSETDLTPASNGAKGVTMIFDGETTGISDVNAVGTQTKEVIYTLSGVRVDKATKPGLYIVNGKKVIK